MKHWIVCLLTVQILGCSIGDKYPVSWPAIAPLKNSCQRLTGIYDNEAYISWDSNHSSPSSQYRYTYLNRVLGIEMPSAKSLEINCIDNNTLIVHAHGLEGMSTSKKISLSEVKWELKNDGLYFPSKVDADADGFGGGFGRERFHLSIGEDGSLIGEESVSAAALVFFVIPTAGTGSKWYKWDRLDSR